MAKKTGWNKFVNETVKKAKERRYSRKNIGETRDAMRVMPLQIGGDVHANHKGIPNG